MTGLVLWILSCLDLFVSKLSRASHDQASYIPIPSHLRITPYWVHTASVNRAVVKAGSRGLRGTTPTAHVRGVDIRQPAIGQSQSQKRQRYGGEVGNDSRTRGKKTRAVEIPADRPRIISRTITQRAHSVPSPCFFASPSLQSSLKSSWPCSSRRFGQS
jgi:hypothetical protein